MTTAVKAIYEDGVFKPLKPLQLDEQTEVEVLIPSPAAVGEENPVDLSVIDDMIGSIRNAPPDMAEYHDRYLYDQPRE
jgi:predicted DNA-binding antitoxin AbrB/MazE fold protein